MPRIDLVTNCPIAGKTLINDAGVAPVIGDVLATSWGDRKVVSRRLVLGTDAVRVEVELVEIPQQEF